MTFRKIADVGVLVGIGIFVGLMIADASTAEHYLSEWQTLVAGILAVIAAAWTVGEMRRNDEMQQARHEELMRLNLRADRLRVARATIPHANEMVASAKRISRVIEGGLIEKLASGESAAFTTLFGERELLEKMVNNKAIKAASDLFDANTAYNFHILKLTAQTAASAGRIVTMRPMGGGAPSYAIQQNTLPDLEIAWRAVSTALDQFAADLLAMKRIYDDGRL